ncbi:PadR family transcriptional regulator [Cellulomonas oligotrophica]|uniref:PadR family transcriptional regulator n=1 Tax=Cellulomonas oligotrophica TaxID=931536 RepID=UPI0031EFAB02
MRANDLRHLLGGDGARRPRRGPRPGDDGPADGDPRGGHGHGRSGHDGPHRGGPGRGRGPGFGPGSGPGFGPMGGGPGHGGPHGPRGRGRARRGDVRAAILALLADGPSNGYGLIKGIAERTGGVWRPSPGSVYPTLQQLTDEGLVAPVDPTSPRTDHALTDAGRAYVAEHPDELEAAWGPAAQRWEEHGELLAASGKLFGVLRQVQAEGSTDQRARAVAQVDALRRELYRMLGEE